MTVVEFYGCTFLAFGPALAMFVFTIAHDPIRIIILIAAAFFWLLSLLLSSLLWFAVIPLRSYTVFGMVFSIFFQVTFLREIFVLAFITFVFLFYFRKGFGTFFIKFYAKQKKDFKKLPIIHP